MFHFFHTYIPGQPFWQGLVRRGMIDDNSGVRIVQTGETCIDRTFNYIAQRGTELSDIITESKRPFFVDRFQGGTKYYEYPFDQRLLEYYGQMLDQNFLGLQMHEWASNYLSDFHKIIGDFYCYKNIQDSLHRAQKMMWTRETIAASVNQIFPEPDGSVYLESQSIEEWLNTPIPHNATEIVEILRGIYIKRKRKMWNYIFTVDSCFMASRLEMENGLRCSMPEIGAQAPFIRIQLAIVRGMHKSRGIPFGAYQEPWGGEPFSCCYYKKDTPGHLVNEWNVDERENSAYAPAGENGGSSLSLLRRVYYYAFLAGVQFLAEEWGAANTFYDWECFELSPYGRVKEEFIRFTRQHPYLGCMYTPVAIVLPTDMKIVNINAINKGLNYFRYYEEMPFMTDAKKEQYIYEVLEIIYRSSSVHVPGDNEANALTNSGLGDLFDIVYEDDPGITERYDYLVDLTCKYRFQQIKEQNKIVTANDKNELFKALSLLQDELSPVRVYGGPLWLLNKTEKDWVVALMNNEGILRTVALGERKDLSCTLDVSICLPSSNLIIKRLYGDANYIKEGCMIYLHLQPGDVFIFSFPKQ